MARVGLASLSVLFLGVAVAFRPVFHSNDAPTAARDATGSAVRPATIGWAAARGSAKSFLSASIVAAGLSTLTSPFISLVPEPAVAATKSEQLGAAKIEGGGASTLQSGRVIAITRGVNLDETNWEGKTLKGVAFQQSVLRRCNFRNTNLFSASFFDADLSGSDFTNAKMQLVNLEMADLSNADLTGADLTQAYMAGAVIKNLDKIDNTDWSDVDMRKDQRTYLCSIAKGTNPATGVDTRESLLCPED